MNEIRTLIKSLESILGNEFASFLRWDYEQARAANLAILWCWRVRYERSGRYVRAERLSHSWF